MEYIGSNMMGTFTLSNINHYLQTYAFLGHQASDNYFRHNQRQMSSYGWSIFPKSSAVILFA